MTELLNTRIEIIFSKPVLLCLFGWFVVKNLCTGSCKFGDNIQVNYSSVDRISSGLAALCLAVSSYSRTPPEATFFADTLT